MTNLQSLRWGRILLGGFLIELLMILLVVPLRAFGGSEDAVTVLAVGGSFLAAVGVAAWLCRALERPVTHGVLMGVCGAAHLALQIGQQMFAPTPTPEVPVIYYFAHGGAVGGWWAARRRG